MVFLAADFLPLNFSPSLDKNWVRRCHHAIIPSGCAGDAIAGRGSHAVSRPRRRRGVRGAWPPDSRGSGIWFDTSVRASIMVAGLPTGSDVEE